MSIKAKVLDYKGTATEFELPEGWTKLIVTVVTGDEIIDIIKDGEHYKTESSYSAYEPFYDGTYEVTPEHFDEWMQREDSYCFWHNRYDD